MMFFLDPEFKETSLWGVFLLFFLKFHAQVVPDFFYLGKRTKISQVINKSQVVRVSTRIGAVKFSPNLLSLSNSKQLASFYS